MKITKILDETAMFGLGAGAAMFGASFAYIGASATQKNFVAGAMSMGAGAVLAHIGSQVAIGAIQRMAGKR